MYEGGENIMGVGDLETCHFGTIQKKRRSHGGMSIYLVILWPSLNCI